MGKSKARKKRAKEDDVNAATELAMAKAVQRVQEIFREHSEEEIRAMLLECNMNQTFTINRLLSQQDGSNEHGASTQFPDSSTTTSSSVLVPNQSDLPNVPVSSGEAFSSFSVPSSSDVTNGEIRSLPASSNVAVLSLSVPSTSDVTNGEIRSVPISSSEAVPPLSVPFASDIKISSNVALPSLSVPSSRALTNVKPRRQETRMISATGPPMAEVLRGLHGPSKHKAHVKADSPLKPDATNPIFNSITESDAARREPNPPVNQSMTTRQQSTAVTASPLGPRPQISMADLNSLFSSAEFQQCGGSNSYTLAHDGYMMNPHYLWRQEQNNVPSLEALQQHGGTSNDTSVYQSLNSVFSQYRNNTLPLSATSSVSSSHGSDYGFDTTSGNAVNSRLGYEDVSRNHLPSNSSGVFSSVGPSSHASAHGVGMSSGNGANSRPWSGSFPTVHLPSYSSGVSSSIGPSHVNGSNSRLGYGDYMPPVHLQGRTSSNEWTVQSEEIYFDPTQWRSPGYGPSELTVGLAMKDSELTMHLLTKKTVQVIHLTKLSNGQEKRSVTCQNQPTPQLMTLIFFSSVLGTL